jgi:isopenicillin N synthase-like dioxygenase
MTILVFKYKTEDRIWINVPPKGVFAVNIGDFFERWTNGLFKSTIHRVAIKMTLQNINP